MVVVMSFRFSRELGRLVSFFCVRGSLLSTFAWLVLDQDISSAFFCIMHNQLEVLIGLIVCDLGFVDNALNLGAELA